MGKTKDNSNTNNSPSPAIVGFWCSTIALGIMLKIWLLCTSQSMPDGDEAVEGLMALHILSEGEHPIYPWGVNYGAGAGWEAHLAALLFAVFGPASVTLKAVGLIHYLITLALVAGLARFWRDRSTAILAAGLFAAAPQTAQWALKCGGGHQVAVILALGGWLCGLKGWIFAAAILLPLSVLAHPIALPFAAIIAVGLIAGERSWQRRGIAVVTMLLAAGIEYLLLRPPSDTVWNPISKSFDPIGPLLTIPRLAIGLFCPNLSSSFLPMNWEVIVALLWLVAVIVSTCLRQQPWWNRAALLAPFGIVFLVSTQELAARHILLASPVAVIVLACAQPSSRFWSHTMPILLALSGCAVQIAETTDPCIYGPGIQSAGVNRANFAKVMDDLRTKGIHYVYCVNPMLQWNILFASQEQIIARYMPAKDRVPAYVKAVDRARREGKPVAVVVPTNRSLPAVFGIITERTDDLIDKYFEPTPFETAPDQ